MKKSKSKKKTQKWNDHNKKLSNQLEMINPNVAGIDLGNQAHYVKVSPDLTDQPIRRFGTFTADLHALADWLEELKIESVAMESTGVYWMGLFEILEQRGFQVLLVNARYPKNVSGRKSDVSDSEWIQQLHSYGLLPGSFIPDDPTRELRTYIRHRQQLIEQKAQQLLRMGKALQLMNVKFQNVIADLGGKLGMKVIRAMVAGEHSATELAKFHTKRLKVSKDDFILSLQGNFRCEHLFTLKQALQTYDFIYEQIKVCEEEIEKVLHKWQTAEVIDDQKWVSRQKTKKVKKNDYSFDVNAYLKDIVEVDLTQIPGLTENTILTILAETGIDMSKWKNAQQFASWASLAPNPKISGDKVLGHFKSKHSSRTNQAFKLAAWGLSNSKCHLGVMYRRLSAKKGSGIAVKAVARKLATIFYSMIRNKTEYKHTSAQEYQKKNEQRDFKRLQQKALKMGYQLQKVVP